MATISPCGRSGCLESECSRLICNHQLYICAKCFAELAIVKNTWPQHLHTLEVYNLIMKFMKSSQYPPNTNSHTTMTGNAFHHLTLDHGHCELTDYDSDDDVLE